MENQYSIEVHNLSKCFGDKEAVVGLDMAIPPGKVCGFLGPNGSGKTTVMRMLSGLLIPNAGSGHCLGYDIIKETAKIKQNIGYMPQRFSLYSRLSVYENLTFVAKLYNISDRENNIAHVMEELHLQNYRDHLASALSGGYKQRLALAAATLHKPKLLLLDEPTAGVDPQSRQEIWDKLQELAKSGITVLVSTHYMDEAERCHYLFYIAYGHLVTAGQVQDIVNQCGLATWLVLGPDVMSMAEKLRNDHNIEQVIERGNELRVSSKDHDLLANAIKNNMTEDYKAQKVRTTLEDVFIYLLKNRQDER